jgi:hypothetical protein
LIYSAFNPVVIVHFGNDNISYVQSLEFFDGKMHLITSVVNPCKLRDISEVFNKLDKGSVEYSVRCMEG